jgi:UDP-4-amino-4,6-dideoxy-N-acetyl-beta-L-altrosamine N-acetyltransferase
MKIKNHGITLIRLQADEDIELLRQWRNSPHIVQTMEYREYITPDMQKEWFKSIDNIHNLYFIISYEGKKIGMINLKNLDWDTKLVESGIFIADKQYTNTFVPAIVSFVMTDMVFRLLKIDRNHAHIMQSNTKAILFNKMIGFELYEGQEEVENQLYFLTRENFDQKTVKLRKAIRTLMGGDNTFLITIEPIDLQSEAGQQWDALFGRIDQIKKIEYTSEGKCYYFDQTA